MPSNIEIKAKAPDLQRKHHLAQAVADRDQGPELLHQHDTFFSCAHGRPKLRQFSTDHGELIAYSRPDQADAKRCDYLITPTSAPALCARPWPKPSACRRSWRRPAISTSSAGPASTWTRSSA